MQATTTRPKITATADGEGVVSHAGSRLLADVADRTTLTAQLAEDAGRAAQAAGAPRSGPGAGRHGGRGRRRRHDDLRCRGAGRSGRVVRAGGVGLDVLAAARAARRRAARRGRAGSGRGAGGRLGAARRAHRPAVPAGAGGRPGAARAGDRPGRLDRGLSQREGAGGADVQEDLRLSPDAGVLRQHRRVPRRGAAPRERGQQHRRRPHRRARRRTRPDPRPASAWHPDPGPGRHRRLHPGVPRPPPQPARHGGELRVLGRLGDHRDKERTAISAIPKPVWADAIDADGGHRDGAGLAEITGVLPARGTGRLPGRDPGRSSAANARTPARSSTRSRNATAGATPPSPPTPVSGSSRTSTPDTARTPGSRTGSAARRTPGSTTSRPGRSRSTTPG